MDKLTNKQIKERIRKIQADPNLEKKRKEIRDNKNWKEFDLTMNLYLNLLLKALDFMQALGVREEFLQNLNEMDRALIIIMDKTKTLIKK